MKDYASMSDHEIGRLVAAANKMDGGGSYGGGTLVIRDGVWAAFDPCNNPADAWPIIVENKISVMWMTAEKEWCAWSQGDLEEGAWCWENVPDYYFCCESYFRAAMVVFLMMKESEK